jgi:hypothetical protein
MASLNGYDSTYASVISSTLTKSVTINAGSNRRMIIACGGEDSGTPDVTDVTYNGTSATQLAAITTGTGSFKCIIQIWELTESQLPSSGAYNLTTTFSSSSSTFDYGFFSVWILDDADQGSLSYDSESQESVTSITFPTGVSVSENDYVCSSGTSGDARSFTSSGSYTERDDQSMGGASFYAYDLAASGSSTEAPTITVSASTNRLNGIIVNVPNFVAGAAGAVGGGLLNSILLSRTRLTG